MNKKQNTKIKFKPSVSYVSKRFKEHWNWAILAMKADLNVQNYKLHI